MDASGLIQLALQYLGHMGVVGQLISLVAMVLLGLPALVTALVALWHSVVGVVVALAMIFPGLERLADSMKAEQAVIDDKSSKVLSVINRMSAILPPVKK